MRRTHLMIAAVAGVVAGSMVVSGPAAAKGPGDAGTPQVVTTWSGIEFYVDRPTTHRLGTKVRKWDRSSDLPTTLVATMGCVRIPNPVAAALCAVAVPVVGSYTIDRLLQADQQHACLRFSLGWAGPGVDVYDGPHCS